MTTKQKIAAKKFLENPSQPFNKIMREAGYSENTVVDPTNLTNSKGWQEIMEAHLADEKLFTVHENALDATKPSPTNPRLEVPDHVVRLKAVELGYKVKKRLGPDVQVNNQNNFTDLVQKERKEFDL